jgi:hypothetical protein
MSVRNQANAHWFRAGWFRFLSIAQVVDIGPGTIDQGDAASSRAVGILVLDPVRAMMKSARDFGSQPIEIRALYPYDIQ